MDIMCILSWSKDPTDRFPVKFWTVFFFKRPRRPYIVFFGSQNIRYNRQKSTRFFPRLLKYSHPSISHQQLLGWLNFKKVGECQNFTRLFLPDFFTFCIEILCHRFESSIWISCAFYRDLRTSQIDSPWNSEHFSFFKRQKPPYIAFLGPKYIRYDCPKSTRLF